MTNKATLLSKGRELMGEFCEVNNIRLPTVNERQMKEWRFDSVCAYYRSDTINICTDACAAIGTSGMAWSYPGYVIDRTPYGVIQHELGHHVDFLLSDQKGAYGGDFSVKLRQFTREPRVTNYCPNDWEWFAEIFRLFVTNSDFLRLYRPKTYNALRDFFKPVVDVPWAQVLKDAPPRTQVMAQRKIQEAA